VWESGCIVVLVAFEGGGAGVECLWCGVGGEGAVEEELGEEGRF
jgi:hypothetical protein